MNPKLSSRKRAHSWHEDVTFGGNLLSSHQIMCLSARYVVALCNVYLHPKKAYLCKQMYLCGALEWTSCANHHQIKSWWLRVVSGVALQKLGQGIARASVAGAIALHIQDFSQVIASAKQKIVLNYRVISKTMTCMCCRSPFILVVLSPVVVPELMDHPSASVADTGVDQIRKSLKATDHFDNRLPIMI